MVLSSTLTSLTSLGWVVLALAAILVGFSKTAIGGISMVAVVVAAIVLPARDSTGVVLVMMLVGDLVATWTYRHNVDWRLIRRLVVPVSIGIVGGAGFLALADNLVLKRTIGATILVLLLIGLWRSNRAAPRNGATIAYGVLAGFTTMVANAGGPPMNLYLLAARYDKWRFLGTTAWFFFAVNVTKVPFSISNGILRAETALTAAILAPLVLIGTWLGRVTIKHIPQSLFERLITVFVAASAAYLLLA